jgi:hypothetical protein
VTQRLVSFSLACVFASATALAQTPVTVSVDASADRRPIRPEIYGLAYASTAELNDLHVPLNRLGGNNTSRYNWQINADNRGADWYFQSIPSDSPDAGEAGDTFMQQTRAAGAEPMLTIPMVGWVGKLGTNRGKLASFLASRYGAQQDCDWTWFPDACNGIRTNGTYVTGNDPNDANRPADAVYQQGWFDHLVNRWGLAGSGGLRYYVLDNEPSIWHGTHRDVHPTGATMDEVRDKMVAYASRIKDTDPGAQVVGPEEWGWSGYFLSGYDQQWGSANGWDQHPDRDAHGGQEYLPWLLDQMRLRSEIEGRRLLDVFTVHYYPQGGESDDVSAAMQQWRNRSTASLWDPGYTDETWIDGEVRLIPRLKEWVRTHYPGTPIGITEYNWGAESHINGATTQADILGIFGREGLDMAARWATPAASTPTYKAIKMYRSCDGSGSGFGETSVRAAVPDPATLSAFAALRASDGALTVMVVSKRLSGSTSLTLSKAGFVGTAAAQRYQLTAANVITRLSDLAYAGNSLVTSVPAQSVTLFILTGQADLIFKDGLEPR